MFCILLRDGHSDVATGGKREQAQEKKIISSQVPETGCKGGQDKGDRSQGKAIGQRLLGVSMGKARQSRVYSLEWASLNNFTGLWVVCGSWLAGPCP